MTLLRALRRAGDLLVRPPRWIPFLLAVIWMAGIFELSSTSFPKGKPSFTWRAAANLAHAPIFGILALLLAAGFLRDRTPGRALPRVGAPEAAVIVGLTGLYGVFDEIHQGLVAGRDASFWDVVTDAAGGGAVVWIIAYLGSEGASERGLWKRMGVGVAACVVSAGVGAVVP